ncbi:Predicted transcription regulator, contains HTH domain, MarR family [Faunimonas pinastri]|uniref:Predicted transcription regulator, contains HTH domain, MarR family n=1 Tax=Faunimonas pinastri TaxID=1855383 RepID=A0A1H9Q5K4_9HYPH|nr:winged helix DNA-binding protein [Faunimonas pinastri]SER55717.1 Predicted transcription regulator, contains HTH domain, MarR family [Faunimonas pinastri]
MAEDTERKERPGLGPIVSSGHLASGALPALSEVEFGTIMLTHAFNRWMVRCMAAAGFPDLSAIDVLVLHNVNHRDKAKTLADICLVLNIEDTHVVSYALKKLEKLGLVKSGRRGKEKLAMVTEEGRAACKRYAEIREALLVRSVLSTEVSSDMLSEMARRIRALSGHYDQASRAAASL